MKTLEEKAKEYAESLDIEEGEVICTGQQMIEDAKNDFKKGYELCQKECEEKISKLISHIEECISFISDEDCVEDRYAREAYKDTLRFINEIIK